VTASWMCVPLPDKLDDVTAAAIANPGMSSWAALSARAGFVSGEAVLILGATGTAGKLAVQVAKRLGARRIVAAGRNHHALSKLTELGASRVIPLDQERASLVAAFRQEFAEAGVDVVLDYLWGDPAECVLEAISQKGRKHASARIRFIQVGESAGRTISLPASFLRSSGLELLGSGFGGASLKQIMQSVEEFLQEAEREPFQIDIKAVPLRDVESLWSSDGQGMRLVFQP
jgi:NADPH:quinone reductase-like Zn-dependent oxidoreductase